MSKIIEVSENLFVEREFLTFLLNSSNLISRMIMNIESSGDIFYLAPSAKSDMISFIPASKVNDEQKLMASVIGSIGSLKSQNMKIGRIVSKLFSKEVMEKHSVTDSVVEDFVNSYKSFFDKDKLVFKIVEGSEIKKWYDQDNYSVINKGTLWNSCMRHKERLKFLNLYCDNNIKMLILTSNENGVEKLRGRALLWDNIISNDFYNKVTGEIKVMDRIYSILDSDVVLFKNWAYDNGYLHKLEQNSKSHLYFYTKNEVLKLSLKIPLGKSNFSYYPYLDTFCYFNSNKGYLTNDEYNMNWDYKLCHANGRLEQESNDEEDEPMFYDDEY